LDETNLRPAQIIAINNLEKSFKGNRPKALITDLDNLPDPDVLALEIIDNIEAGLASFREIVSELENNQKNI